MRRLPALAVALLAPACALDLLGDYEPGGGAGLPVSGGGKFSKLPLDLATPNVEPYVLTDSAAHLSDPTALVGADGQFRLWLGRAPVQDDSSAIAAAELGELSEAPLLPATVVLSADAAWEAGWVGRPSVLDLGDDHLVLYYEGGGETRSIGRADSFDGGSTWDKAPENPVLEAAGEPAAALVARQPILYVTRPGLGGIHLATSEDGRRFEFAATVLSPRPALPAAFDAGGLSAPSALVVATLDAVDPERVALYAVGSRDEGGEAVTSIGSAGSFDGRDFERPGTDAILSPEPPSEGGPAVVLLPTRAILFFHESYRGRLAIAVATSGE